MRLKEPKIEIEGDITEVKRMEAMEECRVNQEGLDIDYCVEL